MAAYNGLIDLSTKRIRVLTAEAGERRDAPRLMRREEPLEHGFESLPEVVDRLVDDGDLAPGRWQLALSGDLVAFHRMHSPLKDQRKVRMTLEFELENALPFRSEEVVVSPLLRKAEEGTDIFAFVTRRDVLEPLLTCFQERRVETVSVVPSVFGAVPVDLVGSGRHLILDLGRERVDVVAIEDGALHAMAALPGGGDLVTASLRQSHFLDDQEAEHAKLVEGETAEGREALAPAVGAFAEHVQRAVRGGLRHAGWRDATVYLCGGAACLSGLVEALEARSGLRVFRIEQIDSLAPDAGQACALAAEVGHLRNVIKGGGFKPVNLRAGDLAHTTDVMKVLQGFRPVAGWAAAVLVLVLMQFFAGVSARDARAARFETARQQACVEIAGIKSGNAMQCLAAMRETIAGTGAGDIPRFDAIDLFSRISQAVPADLEVKLDDVRIDGRSLRLAGTTTGFQQARQLVDALATVRCIVGLRSDKTVKKGDRVLFSLTGKIDCSVEPQAAGSSGASGASTSPSATTGSSGSQAPPSSSAGANSAVGSSGSSGAKPGFGGASKAKSFAPPSVGQTAAQKRQQERLRAAGDEAKVVEGPGEDAESEDSSDEDSSDEDATESSAASGGYDEPIVDPATGVAVPSAIPDPYPNIKPFPAGSLKLPNGVGSVMKLPEDALVDPPPTDQDPETETD